MYDPTLEHDSCGIGFVVDVMGRASHTIVRPSGDIRHIQAFAKIRQDHKGRPVRMIGLNLDITEDKLREKRITQQLDELNRWQQVMMDREDRVIELKREINRLLQQFDLPIRYREVLEEDK